MPDRIALGPLTFLSWAAGITITGAVTFLGIADWAALEIPFIVMFLGGIILLALASRLNITRKSVWSPDIMVAIAVGLVLLAVQSFILTQVFPDYAIESFDSVLVAVLFAIYEETIMLGFSALLVAAGVPDIYNIILSAAFFVPMHALRYTATLFFDLFLTIGRVIMTSALLITDNADTSYAIHILWNVFNSG
ncbi:MAG: hypothetical protein ACTSYX_04965 [Candidatus Thorarchaeota archaeon]